MKKLLLASLFAVLATGTLFADFEDTGPLGAIPDDDPTGISNTIAGSGGGMVTDVTVSMNDLNSTWAGDLIFQVEHEGVTVVIVNRPGGVLDNPPFGHNVDLDGLYMFADGEPDFEMAVFNEDASSAGGDGFLDPGLFSGQDDFAGFNGTSADGDWTMTISDNGVGDVNSCTSWTLTVTTGGACDNPLGDVNGDGSVNLLDVQPFIDAIGGTQCEADINGDGSVTLLDVAPFIALLTGG